MAAETYFKRRWFQFSLLGILMLITAVGAGLGLYVRRVQKQCEVVAFVKQYHGELTYDYQWDRRSHAPGPTWARDWLGDDYFSDLIAVRVSGINGDEPRLSSIGSLRRLVALDLEGCAVGDDLFRRLGELTELRRLNLGSTQLPDAGLHAMGRLTKLTRLELRQTKITDASLIALEGMMELEHLDLAGTSIGDAALQHIENLPRLRYLNLAETNVSDDGIQHLNRLPALLAVGLHGSHVTEEGLTRLNACGTLEKATPPVAKALLALADDTETTTLGKASLSNMLVYLQERHGVGIVLDERVKPTLPRQGDPRVTANLKGPTFSHALRSLLEPRGLTYTIRYEVLFITKAPPRARMRIQEPAAESDISSELLARLEQPVPRFEFVDAPLGWIFEAMKSQHGVAMRVDEKAFLSTSDEDEFLETPITIRVEGVSLKSALELALDGIDADCRIERGDLVVSPRKETPAEY